MHPGFLWRQPRTAAPFFVHYFTCSVSHQFLDRTPVKTPVGADLEGSNFTFASQFIDRNLTNVEILGYFGSRHEASGCGVVAGLHCSTVAVCAEVIAATTIMPLADVVRARRARVTKYGHDERWNVQNRLSCNIVDRAKSLNTTKRRLCPLRSRESRGHVLAPALPGEANSCLVFSSGLILEPVKLLVCALDAIWRDQAEPNAMKPGEFHYYPPSVRKRGRKLGQFPYYLPSERKRRRNMLSDEQLLTVLAVGLTVGALGLWLILRVPN